MDFLKGKKTYILAVVTVGYGIYNHFAGQHLAWPEAIAFIFGGTAMATIRAAIGNFLPD